MFNIEEKSKIKYYRSSVLDSDDLVHAFTTRIGGNTPDPLSTFSLGIAGIPELKHHVEQNRKDICTELNLDYKELIIPDQRHTDNIKIVSSINDDVTETDGLITCTPNLILMLLFADCTPIIIYSQENRILGVIHAGWRGTAKKIIQKGISIFTNEFNVSPKTVKAAIGPAIGQCCYPVSEEVALELQNSINENHDNIFKKEKDSDKIFVDLKQLNAQQMLEVGVTEIDIMDVCTSCNNSLFYSYRADKGQTGRHSAIASLK